MLFSCHYDSDPDQPLWRDVPNADGSPGAKREFSRSFFADLLPNLGVVAVLRLGRADDPGADDGAAAVFSQHDIAYEDLRTGPASQRSDGDNGEGVGAGGGWGAALRALDRIVAVMDACGGGAVAVDCSGGPRGGEVGAVIAAGLVRKGLMGADEAAAWVRLACALSRL